MTPTLKLRRRNPRIGRKVISAGFEVPHALDGRLKVFPEEDFWTIPNVRYRDQVCTYNLLKSRLDSGVERNQNEWINCSSQARSEGDFYVPDMQLCYAIIAATNNHSLRDARTFLRQQIRGRGIMTLTRLGYNPIEEDIVMHNPRMDNQYRSLADVAGVDEMLDEKHASDYLRAVLGTDDVSEVIQTLMALNGTDEVYSWRIRKPKSGDIRAAGFSACSQTFNLDLNLSLNEALPSIGVRLRA
jgi:hypothetical protein